MLSVGVVLDLLLDIGQVDERYLPNICWTLRYIFYRLDVGLVKKRGYLSGCIWFLSLLRSGSLASSLLGTGTDKPLELSTVKFFSISLFRLLA